MALLWSRPIPLFAPPAEPARVEHTLDHIAWQVDRDGWAAELGWDGGWLYWGIASCAAGGAVVVPATGVLAIAMVWLPHLWWLGRVGLGFARGTGVVSAGVHRLSVRRVGVLGVTSLVDLRWSEIDTVFSDGRDLVVVDRQGSHHVAFDLGAPFEVSWLGSHLQTVAPATPSPDRATDERAVRQALDALRTVTAR